MIDEYEFYQGVALRRIVVEGDASVMVRPFVREGRISAFVANGRIGVFIKHSTKRLSPWRFTFTLEQASDLLDLEAKYPDTFVVFLCSDDGLVTLDVGALHEIFTFNTVEKAWVAIERKPRQQYGVRGNRSEHPNKIPSGVSPIFDALKARLIELRSA